MDPAWVQIGIALGSTIVGSAVTGAVWYGVLRGWMARREEWEAVTKDKLTDHEDRIRELERDVRPLDYAR